MMVEKDSAVKLFSQLAESLQKSHPGAPTTQLVTDTLHELSKGEGAGIAGTISQFLKQAPVTKMSDGFKFSDSEQGLWDKLMDLGSHLGNGAFGMYL